MPNFLTGFDIPEADVPIDPRRGYHFVIGREGNRIHHPAVPRKLSQLSPRRHVP